MCVEGGVHLQQYYDPSSLVPITPCIKSFSFTIHVLSLLFFHRAGDLKGLLLAYGLSQATASFPCIFCEADKDDFISSKIGIFRVTKKQGH